MYIEMHCGASLLKKNPHRYSQYGFIGSTLPFILAKTDSKVKNDLSKQDPLLQYAH